MTTFVDLKIIGRRQKSFGISDVVLVQQKQDSEWVPLIFTVPQAAQIWGHAWAEPLTLCFIII